MSNMDPFAKMELPENIFPVKPLVMFEGWRDFVRATPHERPVLPPIDAFAKMSKADRTEFDRLRREYHSKFPPIRTNALKEVLEKSLAMAASNFRSGPGVRPGVILDGLGTVGKSTIATELGRAYEVSLRKRFNMPGDLKDGNLYIPVIYVTLPGELSVNSLLRIIAMFLAVPGASRNQKTSWYDEQIIKTCADTGVTLIIIDDIHFLKMKNKGAPAINNHLKSLQSSISATFIYAGIDVGGTGLLTEGNGEGKAAISQTDARFTKHDIRPFSKDDPEFLELLLAFEKNMLLMQQKPRSILTLAEYIHNRTNGFVGAINQLFREGGNLAIKTGVERLTKEVFEKIKLSHRSEAHRNRVMPKKPTAVTKPKTGETGDVQPPMPTAAPTATSVAAATSPSKDPRPANEAEAVA